jgi:phosphoribosylformimino-5-aminoimidazole carboxamide ribotide isomerase
VQVIPAIDVEQGRSRVVFWPGVSTGVGAPTDRPERIAEHFVGLGAPLVLIVDFDGARRGAPVNVEAIGAIAAGVATPLQIAVCF